MENLSNNSVISLYQDKKGLLWIGTCDGLNIYNGHKISLYKSINEEDVLSGSLIDKITETEDGKLWVQTYYGVDLLNKEKKALDKFSNFNKRLFTEKDTNNNFYIIQKDSCIFYYNNVDKQFHKIDIPQIVFNNILFFSIDSRNVMHIINQDGSSFNYNIIRSTDSDISFEQEKGYQHPIGLIYCFESEEGMLFVDKEYKLYELNTEKQKVSFILDVKELILKNGHISSIIKFHDDFFIGFKTSGLFRLRSDIYGYSTEDIPINSGVFCLLKDNFQDIIWIGTDGQGVYSYSNDLYSIRSTLLNDFTFKINRPIRTIYIDENRTLWIGSKGDGIAKIYDYDVDKSLQNNKIEYLTIKNSSLWDNSVYSFCKGKKDILWIGTEEGLNYYSSKEKKIKQAKLSHKGTTIKYIHDIYEQDSLLWIASVGMGIVKAKIKWHGDNPELVIVKRFIVNNGDMSSNYFFSFFVEGETIWAANRGSGVFKLNTRTDKLENIRFNNNTLDEIYSICKDNDNNYLIGTSSGLVKYRGKDDYQVFNKTTGFPNNVIHCILPEEDGTFWLSTNNGMINYNSKNNSFRLFNHLDGLVVSEFSDGALYNDRQTGSLLFGGINGFISILEDRNYLPSEYIPPIFFSDLFIFGKEYNISDFFYEKGGEKVLTLNHDQNFFSFTFNAIDYLNGNNYNYQYKFDELNTQWVNNGNSNSISLTNFAPGEYTLLTKYYNMAIGKESPVYSIRIKILPPWYKTNWAYIIYAFLVLLIIGACIRAVLIKEEKRKRKALRIIEQKHREEVHESKLRFFTNIAHEFCTPLTLIYAPCNRILNQKNTDKSIIKYTQIIQQNAERLNTLIQDLIKFRQIETGHKSRNIEKIDITELITHITNAFTDLAESKNVDFEIQTPVDIIWNSDKDFLITIITNLLSNAFKYTTENGHVRISTSKVESELHISISNSGKGIRADDIPKVFDRYSILDNFENQERSRFSSRNGLGLAISNNMVNLLDGEINIDSTPNEWTHFTVILPFLESNAGAVKKQELPEIKPLGVEHKSLTIEKSAYNNLKPTLLIIDDELDILWLIKDIFNEAFNVVTAENASEASSILSDIHPDIIICDIMMPDMDGIDFVKNVKGNPELAHIPLVLISAEHEIERQIEGMSAGAELYITKPFNSDYLRTSVSQLISRKKTLKDYFASPKSAYELAQGKLNHKEHKKFVKEILNIINKHIQDKDLSVNFIANKMNMSTRNLYRKIGEIEDISITDMIRDCRLHIAKDLLIKSRSTVDEIIFKSGFANRVSFFKAFSKKYGCTPKEYRDKNSIKENISS